MTKQGRKPPTPLSQHEAALVSGAAYVVQAQDMYGNTMSVEEFMDRQVAMLNDASLNPHDFYSPGFNSDKPNIYRRG